MVACTTYTGDSFCHVFSSFDYVYNNIHFLFQILIFSRKKGNKNMEENIDRNVLKEVEDLKKMVKGFERGVEQMKMRPF